MSLKGVEVGTVSHPKHPAWISPQSEMRRFLHVVCKLQTDVGRRRLGPKEGFKCRNEENEDKRTSRGGSRCWVTLVNSPSPCGRKEQRLPLWQAPLCPPTLVVRFGRDLHFPVCERIRNSSRNLKRGPWCQRQSHEENGAEAKRGRRSFLCSLGPERGTSCLRS